MKFLSKNNESSIIVDNEVYLVGNDNSNLRQRLLNEQHNFCAYTEKYIVHGIDSTDVEHFNPSIKGHDDYFNYYTTLRSANERKSTKYKTYAGSDFFDTLFFQDQFEFDSRIKYEEFIYDVRDAADQDGKNFIDYLGFNDDYLFGERINHIRRLRETLDSFTPAELYTYFKRYKNDLSYVTAIEDAFKIDLSGLVNDLYPPPTSAATQHQRCVKRICILEKLYVIKVSRCIISHISVHIIL